MTKQLKVSSHSNAIECNTILTLDPNMKQCHVQIHEMEALKKQKMEKMKEEVLGNLKKAGNFILGKFGMSLDNFGMNQNQDGSYNIQFKN